ncbi:MAG TPA: hypothetical protein VHX86_11370 [Tepidisphaeraceae bacterium]|jgi:hypothetical protein|nr:hypothetical protein [Tepidisphaeraceae bacterium]
MLHRVLITTISVLAFSALAAHADPKDDIQAAIQKLADSPNYTWTTTVEGGFRGGPQTGKTQKDGLTSLSLQMRDNSYEILMKGDNAAVKMDDGWKSKAELTAAAADQEGFSPERFLTIMIQNYKTPTAQAQDLVSKLQNIQKTDDGYSADMTEDAAKEMLTFRPRRATTNPDSNVPQMQVTNPKGSIKLWIKDGDLTKVEFHVTGTVSFNDNDRDVDRTTTTEFKDVGSTTIDVPADAKAKLGS